MHLLKPLLKPLAAATLAFSAFTASAVTVYDAALDFSTTSNPNGVWSYGTTNGFNNNTFTLLPDNSPILGMASWNPAGSADLPAVYKNNTLTPIVAGTATYAPGSIGFHPGSGNTTAVYRFTAPTTALYSFNATAFAQDTHPTTTQVALVLPDNTLYTGTVTSVSATNSFAATGTITLTAGQTLNLEVGNGGNGNLFDSTGATFTVTVVPEPETTALMLAGLAALGFVAKRRKN